ncbi:MAG TPA: hypothetical protein VKW06_00495 [Candidatus Angelobacter sp.]|nr:hypothetical protein [Candidatus Angelobacter sp.]
MNPDKKELIETFILAFLTIVFTACSVLCVKWGASYQTLMVFSGLAGSALGALAMKMKASSNGNAPPPSAAPVVESPIAPK